MRRLARMTAVTAIALGMLFVPPGLAEERNAGKKKQETAVTGAVQQEKKTERDAVRKKEGPAWPRPYKPTEEISADSTVPFPTDI